MGGSLEVFFPTRRFARPVKHCGAVSGIKRYDIIHEVRYFQRVLQRLFLCNFIRLTITIPRELAHVAFWISIRIQY